jgi:hypothetical protein
LQCQVKARRGFTGTGDAYQSNVCLLPIFPGNPVIMFQRVSYGLDALVMFDRADNAVGKTDGRRRGNAQFSFYRANKNAEAIQMQRTRSPKNTPDFRVDDSAEHEWPKAVLAGPLIDLLYHGCGLLRRIEVRQRDFVKRQVFKLPQKTMSQHFDGNAGSVRQKEGRAVAVPLWLTFVLACQ